jgi:hypothetical protein
MPIRSGRLQRVPAPQQRGTPRLHSVGHNLTVRPLAFPRSLFKKLRLIWHQIVRAKRLQAAYRKAEATFPRENAPKAEDIRGLGLLGKESQSAKVLGLE